MSEKIDKYYRVDVLKAILPNLRREVLAAAQAFRDESRRTELLVATAPHLPAASLRAARDISNVENRAKVVLAVIPHLSKDEPEVVAAEVLALSSELADTKIRANLFSVLVEQLNFFSVAQLYEIWQANLISLSRRPRRDLLADITVLMPIISRLGGNEGVRQTRQAVHQAAAWWP